MTKWRETGAYRRRKRGMRRKQKRPLRSANADESGAREDRREVDDDSLAPMFNASIDEASVEKSGGFFSRVWGSFSRKKEAAPKSAPPATDFVREILSVPRGIARLDAFERILEEYKEVPSAIAPVALAYHRELTYLAQNANLDLALLSQRAERCANALLKTGEIEKAGEMLARIGHGRKASELFVEAGAIEKLERVHDDMAKSGGTQVSARMAYDRFEGLFALGLRKEALRALHEAARLWPDNGIYKEIADGFSNRVLKDHVRLKNKDITYDIFRKFPMVIGRGEGANIRVNSPLVSRAHVELRQVGERVIVHDLQKREDVLLNGSALINDSPLPEKATLNVAGIEFMLEKNDEVLRAQSDVFSQRVFVLPLHDTGAPLLEGALHIDFYGEGEAFVRPTPGVSHEGRALKKPLMLLRGDTLTTAWGEVAVMK